jgi:hypothetical protein
MTTTKILLLAGFAVMSLGAGNAMADGSGVATNDYWAQQYRIEAGRAVANSSQAKATDPVQYGPSDTNRLGSELRFDTPMVPGGF